MIMSPSVRSDLLAARRLVRIAGAHIFVDGVPIGSGLPSLSAALYTRWYAGWWPPSPAPHSHTDIPAVPAQLRSAHAGTERFDSGWVARAVSRGGGVLASRGAEQLHLESGDYVNRTRMAAPVRSGDLLDIVTRRDTPLPLDGWWQAWAATGPAPTLPMLRIYWNSGLDAAASLVRAITTVLEARGFSYTMKCPSQPELFGRRDSIVLYLSPAVWTHVKAELRDAHSRVAPLLRPSTPPFTLWLGRGVALAQDPGNGYSFGETMAWAVADGVLSAHAAGLHNEDEWLSRMAERLIANGVSPLHPYRGAEEVASW